MKFTISWLKEYLDTPASLTEICDKLTAIGLEVEKITDRTEELAAFTVAHIKNAEPHPNADRLQVCQVDTGAETLQIVCGAPNARAGIKVALAPVGSIIPTNGMKIKQAKIRDIDSCGMMCSADELGIGDDSSGIIELPDNAEIGSQFASIFGLDDPMIEIAITPNRGDCLGAYGIARDLAAAGLGALKPLNVAAQSSNFKSDINVSIENTEKTPLFIGRYIKGVKNGDSPLWLQNRLRSIGLKPISTLVDITNYLTFDLGRPAHVYDAGKLEGNLTVRDAKGGEKLLALDDKEYTLEAGMTVVSDENAPVALGGVIGGKDTGCTLDTADIFLEIALFDPIDIATTGRKLMIESDARYRFERSVDPAFLRDGAEIATKLILDLCDGEASELVIAGKEPEWQKTISLRDGKVESLIGISPSKKEIANILHYLGFSAEEQTEKMEISVPSWRSDISGEADLVEEIARIYGYDKIPSIPLPSPSLQTEAQKPTLSREQKRVRNIRRLLASRSLKEIISYSFLSSEKQKIFGDVNCIMLSNPISSDLDQMRPSLIPNMLEALQKNTARSVSNIALFELGPVFTATGIEGQQKTAAGIRSGNICGRNIHESSRNIDIFDVKADALAALGTSTNPDNIKISQGATSYYHPGRSGTLKLGNTILGYFGEIHPGILQQLEIDVSVVAFELLLDNLPPVKKKKTTTRAKLSRHNYQPVERDFAFIIDEKTPANDILSAVKSADKKLIENITLFDVYAGKNIENGKKSVAFSVLIQPKTATLTDDEITAISDKIITKVQSVGGVLRDGS